MTHSPHLLLLCGVFGLAFSGCTPQGTTSTTNSRNPYPNQPTADFPFDENGNYIPEAAVSGRSYAGTSSPPIRSTGYDTPASASAEPSNYTPPPAPKPKPKPSFAYHTVKSGDTLWAISRKYGTSVSRIQSANSISGSIIRPGQRLKIPN
ncbi:MAG: LysM peptidoglycan-binding domain-containing protein [Verrucomicrobiota bacterium]